MTLEINQKSKQNNELDELSNEELVKRCIEAGRPKELVNEVIIRNKKLIPYVINNFHQMKLLKRAKHLKEDLEQEGVFGLIEAIKRFDLTKGTKFSTYATWWVLQACSDYVSKNYGTIRLPNHVRTQLSSLQKINTENDLQTTIGDTEEITSKKKTTLLAAVQAQKVQGFLLNDKTNLLTHQTPETLFDGEEITKIIKKNIEGLNPVYKKIICMRYNADFIDLIELTKENRKKL